MANIPSRVSGLVASKYQRGNNTFSREVKSNPKDRINVEIGDSKQAEFKPQFKISRWDNEVNFSLRAEEHPAATIETQGEIIKYKTPDYEVHMYDKPEVSEDGGFEFEWVLPKKPKTNVLSTTIQTKGLKFNYQSELTQEEIDEGAERPENVEGSYAVYHATKGGMNDATGMEYKMGKAFHIYRPKVTDVNGNETWGELNINEKTGKLTVTVDQTFLDNAVYPVIVDPTFGFESIGGSNSTFGDTIRAPLYTSGVAGTADKITFYLTGWGAGSGNFVKCALYLDSDVSLLSPQTAEHESPQSDGWFDFGFTGGPSISSSTDYEIAGWSDASIRYYYDASGSHFFRGLTYGSWPDPGGFSDTNRKVSIYATYTESGGAAAELGPTMTTNTSFWGS